MTSAHATCAWSARRPRTRCRRCPTVSSVPMACRRRSRTWSRPPSAPALRSPPPSRTCAPARPISKPAVPPITHASTCAHAAGRWITIWMASMDGRSRRGRGRGRAQLQPVPRRLHQWGAHPPGCRVAEPGARPAREGLPRHPPDPVDRLQRQPGCFQEQIGYLDQHQPRSPRRARPTASNSTSPAHPVRLARHRERKYSMSAAPTPARATTPAIAEARTLAGMGRLLNMLEVARNDLPTPAELGQDRSGVDAAELCPPEAPTPLQIDKEALFAEARCCLRFV